MKHKITNKKLFISVVISFCVIILFSVILATVGIATILSVKEDYGYTISVSENKIRLLKDIKTDYMIMRYRAANYVMNNGDAEYIYKTAHLQYQEAMASLYTNADDYIRLNRDDARQEAALTEDNIRNAESLKTYIAEYTEQANLVMELSVQGEARAADDILKDVIPIAEGTLALLDDMIDDTTAYIASISNNVNDATNMSVIFLSILAVILVIFSSVLSFAIVNSIARYIDELHEAERAAEEASRLKSVFLANMSHEIRTPMNSIVGFSELALDGAVSPETRDYLEKIKQSSEGLLQIINDVLDSSKIEARKLDLENIPFQLEEVFKACHTIIEPKAIEKGISLYCYAEPSVGKRLLGDPTRLRQILLNLLSNAVKFTNVGIVKLMSNVKDKTDHSVTMHFEIKDSGIGLSSEQISVIFDTFTQADGSTTRKYGGTGLGLSITRNIIELMGGTLSVESTPGVGSKFSFDLTFQTIDVAAENPVEEAVLDIRKKPTFIGEVLVCEDNHMNQQVVCTHLEKVGLHYTVADNGKVGVACVQDRMHTNAPPYDLIFMDIHMPVMDGLEAAKELVKIGCRTPIVALTANIMSGERDIYRQAGMQDCLAKPFTAQELWTCLMKYISPVSLLEVNAHEQSDADNKLRAKLYTDFIKDHASTYQNIEDAVRSGNISLAARLAHTLKGVAGLLGRSTLQESAGIVERALSNGRAEVTETQLRTLKQEHNKLLSDLRELGAEPAPEASLQKPFDRSAALTLLEKLEIMLQAGDSECLDFTEDVAKLPGSEALVQEMEAYRFKQALQMLPSLRESLVNANE